MDLDTHHELAHRQWVWLDSRLREEGLPALAKSFETLGESGVLRCREDQRPLIQKYLQSSPAQRRQIERKLAPGVELHAFLLAAAYVTRCGAALLQFACQYGFSTSYNPAPAFLLMQAAEVATDLHRHFPTVWPFEDDLDPANDL